MQYSTNTDACQIGFGPGRCVDTPVGRVGFHGDACPWDREAVRALVHLVIGGGPLPLELEHLPDLADRLTADDWGSVAIEIERLAATFAGMRQDRESRAAMRRLLEILGPHLTPYRCPQCGESFATSAQLDVHFSRRVECRACSDLLQSTARIGIALCAVCRRAIVGEWDIARSKWVKGMGVAHAECADKHNLPNVENVK